MGWSLLEGSKSMSIYNLIMNIDPQKLELERFSLTPDMAREMLTERGTVPKPAPRKGKTPAEPKAQVKRRCTVLHLTEAQERAFANYVEGLK